MLSLILRHRRFVIALILLCFTSVSAAIISRAQVVEIQGNVRTADGKPIDGVFISRFGKTDETGHFKIASDVLMRYWKTLIFDKKGFVPKVVSLDASNRNLTIILEPETDNRVWDLPSCSAAKVNGSRFVGQYLRLTVPKELKFKSGVDADYISYVIGLPERGNKHWLRGGWGNLYGDVYPGGEKLFSLDHYSYRRTSVGIDWRGVTNDGKYWRYFGAPSVFETYHYETDSKRAADMFDKILDGVCFQSNNRL